jgi:hypothetical protein
VKLPNAHLAVVERHKVVGDLLNAAHPDNNGKARFFGALGFSVDAPEGLIAALLGIRQTGEVAETTRSAHGEKHVVEGWLPAHTGENRARWVRTVWIVDRGSESPRLVTAYPGKE